VRAGGGWFGGDERYPDLRVDDHRRPAAERARVVDVRRAARGLAPLGLGEPACASGIRAATRSTLVPPTRPAA
jgi:hypothetical protein